MATNGYFIITDISGYTEYLIQKLGDRESYDHRKGCSRENWDG
ncbi:MAG TPA: hypothetical protein VN653_04465 [Anaerolineales bacterium]|nr:hypothetical protein [Anaerolineales bacterium]